ncbi:MAG: LON peptidase substrate-binding domain-containing protein [Acidimicrobiia bacterium]|nr:LON peptidase substrate-binding domain-containing protein [Acidimicrobiia bacterium]
MLALPVFPLPRVLVPSELVLVHVFEKRYLQMLDELADDRFGIVLIREGSEIGSGATYHDVGTIARIAESRKTEDGRCVLAMVGEQRFEVIDRLAESPYPSALVEVLDEGPSEDCSEILELVSRRLRRYLVVSAESGHGGDVLFQLSSEPATASYQVASLLRLLSPERQDLLELPTARSRLEREERLLEREVDLLERVMGVS